MKYYCLKYRLCMQHSFDGNEENRHSHLIDIRSSARHTKETFLEFADMDSILEQVFHPYQYRYLNDCPEFEGDTSMEHLGEVFYRKLRSALMEQHWQLARFEISETPLRVYAIGEEIF